MNKAEHFKSGFVAVVGRPNVGKSTMINALIGDKIAIVSDKAQTTRNRIICVYTDEEKQIVFMDTPGVHKPKHKLGEFMVDAAIESLKETEAVLFVVAGNEKRGPGDNFIIEQLKRVKVPVFLVVNKIDTLQKEQVLEAIVSYQDAYPFAGVIPISAKNKENLSELLTVLGEHLPEGPQYFPEDMITDQPERLIISDIVREKILLSTRDEIPHAIAVDVDEMKTRDDGTTYIVNAILKRALSLVIRVRYYVRLAQKRAWIFKSCWLQKCILIYGLRLKKIGAINRVCFQNWDIKNRLFRLIIVRKDCYGQYRCPVTDWVRHSMYFLN